MVRRAVAWILAGMLMLSGAFAQEVVGVENPAGQGFAGYTMEDDRLLPGEYEDEVYIETPEDIIVAALEVYSWFTISPLDVDTELVLSDGSAYRVADESLCSYDVIISLLKTIFSDQIIEEMFAYEVYTVVDGMLYTTLGGGRSIDMNISHAEYQEVFADEQKIVYQVTVHYLDEEEYGILPDVFEFVRERFEEEWLFTQFTFFW